MHDHDVEDVLRAHYNDHDADGPPQPSIDVVLARGRSRSQRRRRTQGAAGAAAVAAVVAAIAVAVPTLTDGPTRTRDGAPAAPSSSNAATGDLVNWARSLDRIATPDDLAVLAGGRLVVGPSLLTLRRGTDLGLEAMTDAGAVVLVERDRTGSGGQFTSESVIVRPNGRVQLLPTGSSATVEVVRSPDGSLLAHDGQVLDVRSLEVVASLPPGAVTLEAWTTAGIIFRDGRSRDFVFDLETGGTAALSGDVGSIDDGASAGITTAAGCGVVTTLDSSGEVRRDDSLCTVLEPRRGIAVSPDGTSVVTDELEVVDVASGSVRRLGPATPAEQVATIAGGELVWSSDAQFYVVVRDAESAVVVGCDLRVDSCARVSDEMSVGRDEPIELAVGAG